MKILHIKKGENDSRENLFNFLIDIFESEYVFVKYGELNRCILSLVTQKFVCKKSLKFIEVTFDKENLRDYVLINLDSIDVNLVTNLLNKNFIRIEKTRDIDNSILNTTPKENEKNEILSLISSDSRVPKKYVMKEYVIDNSKGIESTYDFSIFIGDLVLKYTGYKKVIHEITYVHEFLSQVFLSSDSSSYIQIDTSFFSSSISIFVFNDAIDMMLSIFSENNIKYTFEVDLESTKHSIEDIKEYIYFSKLSIRELFDEFVETSNVRALDFIKKISKDFDKEFMKTINKLDNHQRIIIYAYYKNYKKLLQRIKRADNIEDFSCYFDELYYNYRTAFEQFLVDYIIANANSNELSDALVNYYDKYLIDEPFMSEKVQMELYENYKNSILLNKLIPSFKKGEWTSYYYDKNNNSIYNTNTNVCSECISKVSEPFKSLDSFKKGIENKSLEEHLTLLRVEIEYLVNEVNDEEDFIIENHFNTLLFNDDMKNSKDETISICNGELYYYFNMIKTIEEQWLIKKVLEGLQQFIKKENLYNYLNFIVFASENKIKYDKYDFLTVIASLFDIYRIKHMDRVLFYQEHKRKPYVQLFLIDEYLSEVETICINKTTGVNIDPHEKNLYLSKMASLYQSTDDKEELEEALREKIENNPTREEIENYAKFSKVEDLLFSKNIQAAALVYEYMNDLDFGAGADKVYQFKEGYPEEYIQFVRIIFREALRKINNYEKITHSYMDILPELAYSLYDVDGGLKWFNLIVEKVLETNCSYLKKLFYNILKAKKIEV